MQSRSFSLNAFSFHLTDDSEAENCVVFFMKMMMRNCKDGIVTNCDDLTASFFFELGHRFIEDMGARTSG